MMKLTILFFIGLFVPEVTAKVGETTEIELEAKKRQLAYSVCNAGTFNCGAPTADAICTLAPNVCTFSEAMGTGCKFSLAGCAGYKIFFTKAMSGDGTAQSTVLTANADMAGSTIQLMEGISNGACIVAQSANVPIFKDDTSGDLTVTGCCFGSAFSQYMK
jgi:hypothetical protein